MLDITRIFNLIKATKDKFIYHDESVGDFVVLSLEDYERLVQAPAAPKKGAKKPAKNTPSQDSDNELSDLDELDDLDEELAEKFEEDQYYFEPVDDKK